jgi:hypothetical protein
MKLFFAAPLSALPSDPSALGAHASRLAHRWSRPMIDEAEKRGQLIRHLEDALALADEIEDGRESQPF